MTEKILSLRELNRATLARQLLLERSSISPLAAIKQLAGMQSQLPNPPYIGLWGRLNGFERNHLTQLLEERQVVRTSMMRGTLHVTTAEDYLLFRPALHSLHTRGLEAYFTKQRGHGLEKERLLREVSDFVDEKPRTNVELRLKLKELFPGQDEQLLYRVRQALPLIQVFPGGVWGVGGSPRYTRATSWLGRDLVTPAEGLPYLIQNYLAAFGPASIKDLQIWSGLKRLETAVEALRPSLVTFRDEQGRELFDLPDAPRPPADTPVPVRFLPDFDNLVLAYDDRRRIVPDAYRPLVFPGYSMVLPTFLVDGFVRGIWNIERTKTGLQLVIQAFEPLPAEVYRELEEEGERLLAFVSDTKKSWDISFFDYQGKTGRQNLWGRA